MGFNSPLPVRLPEECRKAANIIRSFVDSGNSGIDKVVPRYVMEKASGFAVFTVVKAGLVFSARAGSGIVIAKLDDGSWSAPSAIGIGGVGFGGQMGAEVTDFFIVLNSRAAVATFMSAGSLTLGGNLSIAVGPLGRNAEGSGSVNTNGRLAAMYSYSKTKGLFGGVSVEGSVIVERQDANRLAYGSTVSSKQLLSGAIDSPDWAQPLVDQITRSIKLPGGQTWRRRDEEEDRGEFDRDRDLDQGGGYAFGEGVGAGGVKKSGNRKRAGSLASTFGKSSSPSPSPRPDGPTRRLSSLNPFSSGSTTPRRQPKSNSESYNIFGPEGDIEEGKQSRTPASRDSPSSYFPVTFDRAQEPPRQSTADLMIWDDVPPKNSSMMTKSSTDPDLLGSWASDGRGLTASFNKLSTTNDDKDDDPWTPRERHEVNEDEHLPRETVSQFASAEWKLSASRNGGGVDSPSRLRKERPFSSFFESRSSSYGGDDKGTMSGTRLRADSGGERPFAAYQSPPIVTSPSKPLGKIPLKAGLEGAEDDGLPRAVGLYDFTAGATGDLGFKAGQVVVVLNKVGDGKWWNGRNPLTGQVGIFPSSYVEELQGGMGLMYTMLDDQSATFRQAAVIQALHDPNAFNVFQLILYTMSDTREAAQEELIAAGMASGMDDTLGSSFATSFAVPPPPPKAAPAPEPEQKKDTPAPTSDEPEEELEDWRPEYEARLKAWQEESAIAREKAEKTRARIEKQREEERKAAQGSDAKAEKQRKEAEARKAKLQEELEGRKTDAKKAVNDGSAKDQAERGQKVKEAWEMVKKAGEPSSKEVTTDGRGVTANDTNVHIAGESKAPIQPTMYDPTTSTEPIPPTMQDPSPPATTRSIPTGSTSQSRQSATSQAWEEISGGASSAEDLSPPGSSSDELIDVSSSNNALGRGMTEPVPRQISPSGLSKTDNNATPPSQPPSLTLSLFSTPSHLSASRVLAVLGINLVLPFINGVMLGLGEIFARETLQVIGRKWWRNKRSIFGGSWGEAGKHETPAGRGVGSVGLSGSGGFP